MKQLSATETAKVLELMVDAYWSLENNHKGVSDPERMRPVFDAVQAFLHPPTQA